MVAGVDLEAAPGCVTALVGPNGSGKSTLVRLAAGLLTPDRGAIRLGNARPAELDERERSQMVTYLPQRPSVALGFSVREVVAMGALHRPAAEARSIAAETLGRLGLSDRASEPAAHLSGGQQQRTALARALVQIEASPTTAALLADEPTSAMDPRHAIETLQTLRALAVERSLAVVLVVHDLALAVRFADRVCVLSAEGGVAAQGSPSEVLGAEVLEGVFGVRFTSAEAEIDGQRFRLPVPTEPIDSEN